VVAEKVERAREAAEIIAKNQAKKDRNSGIFTELQEKKRQDLGLHPTLRPEPKVVRDKEKKRPANQTSAGAFGRARAKP
jgi:hypothetical protein